MINSSLVLLWVAPAGLRQGLYHSPCCGHTPGEEQAPCSKRFLLQISVAAMSVAQAMAFSWERSLP